MITKAILLCGGTGSRLGELTKFSNKHVLPIGEYPMLYYPLIFLKQLGVEHVRIVVGKEHAGGVFANLNEEKLGLKLSYSIQYLPDGIAGAVRLCSDFIDRHVLVHLGDNIFEHDENEIRKLRQWSSNCKLYKKAGIVVKNVETGAHRFGVLELSNSAIVEKPPIREDGKDNGMIVTGLYAYPKEIIQECLSSLQLSNRGEFEITDVNNYYLQKTRLQICKFDKMWSDAGELISYRFANEFVWNNQDKFKISQFLK